MKVNQDDTRALRERLPILLADLEDGQARIHHQDGLTVVFGPVEIGADYICYQTAANSMVRTVVPFHAIVRIELN